MISDKANIVRERISRAASLVLAVFMAFSLSGCCSDNSEEPRNSQGPYPPTTPSVTDSTPSVEPQPSHSQAIESSAPATEQPPTEPVEPPISEPADEELVRVMDYIPTIHVELKYATEDNFTGKVIYDFSDAYLRYGTVKKLMDIQSELAEQGYSLKIWDAYRPVSAQFTLWEAYPDPVYVADPNNGYSSHSKGNTVDVTLVRSDGTDIPMPSGFDDFSTLADRDYSDVSSEAAANATLLENTMSAHGFTCYSGEWWHFSDDSSS